MTRAEALTKWCPFASVITWDTPPSTLITSTNRDPTGAPMTACLCCANACAVWEEDLSGNGNCGLMAHVFAMRSGR